MEMRRKGVIAKIIVWAVVLILALGVFVYALTGNGFSNGSIRFFGPIPILHLGNDNGGSDQSGWNGSFTHQGDFVTVKEDAKAVSGRELLIDWSAGNVTLLKSDSDQLRVVQKAQKGIDEKQLFVVKEKGNKVEIIEKAYEKEHVTIGWNSMKNWWASDLEIYLPEEQFREISTSLIEGEFQAQGLKTGDLSVDTVSGDVIVSGSLDELSVESVSGNVLVDGLSAQRSLKVDSISGNLSGEKVSADEVELDSTSGNLNLTGEIGSLSMDTISGDGTMASTTIPKEVEFSSTSGDLKLLIPENEGFRAELDTMSGDFSSDYATQKDEDVYTYGNGSAKFSADTLSGNFKVTKL